MKNIASRVLLKTITWRKPKSSTGKCGLGGLQNGGQALKAFLAIPILPICSRNSGQFRQRKLGYRTCRRQNKKTLDGSNIACFPNNAKFVMALGEKRYLPIAFKVVNREKSETEIFSPSSFA